MIKKHIPNFITCLNLLCGCLGLVAAFNKEIETAVMFIWAAAIFDFFDGFAARLLKVSSPIGKELDSLADMVTFGVLPAFIMYTYLSNFSDGNYAVIAFLIAIFAALRLAKFNIDTRQETGFIGLPTPAMAFFVSGLPYYEDAIPTVFSLQSLLLIVILLSAAMVLPVPLLALKFKNFSLKDNSLKWLLLVVGVVLLVFLKAAAFPLVIIFYFLLSLVNNYAVKQ